MAEWSKALDLGSSLSGGVGSNPTAIRFCDGQSFGIFVATYKKSFNLDPDEPWTGSNLVIAVNKIAIRVPATVIISPAKFGDKVKRGLFQVI